MIKKAQAQVGGAIIIMAILLLVGGIFFDDGDSKSSKSIYLEKKQDPKNPNYIPGEGYLVDGYLEENYLFYLNQTDIGRQRKVTQSFPNIELGSKEEFNTVYLGNSFRLNANPFTSNAYSFDVQLSEPENVRELLLYFEPTRTGGDQELIVRANGVIISQNLARSSDIPLKIQLNPDTRGNLSKVRLTFQLVKPAWFSLFNWNKMDVENLRVVELIQNKKNNFREFNFNIDKKFLEDVIIDLSVSCEQVEEFSEAIKVTVNGFIVANSNPTCTSRFNRISSNVSLNILNSGKNTIEFETDGFYKVGYSVSEIYFNDQETYKFNINSFNDIIDVVMYGEFDKEVIDVRINTQTLSLRRDEIKSIVSFLRFGTNEIRFLNKPLEIEEFVIEKNEFLFN